MTLWPAHILQYLSRVHPVSHQSVCLRLARKTAMAGGTSCQWETPHHVCKVHSATSTSTHRMHFMCFHYRYISDWDWQVSMQLLANPRVQKGKVLSFLLQPFCYFDLFGYFALRCDAVEAWKWMPFQSWAIVLLKGICYCFYSDVQ